MSTQTLQTNIMRRVYYAFVVRLTTHPVTIHLGILLIAGYLFGRLVHVAAVYHTFLNVRIGELGQYILQTLWRADTASLIVFGVLIFTTLSLQWQLLLPRIHMKPTRLA